MTNMSHCRFENTFKDLSDCYESMSTGNNCLDQLSEHEKKYAIKLVKLCRNISDDFLDEVYEKDN